MKLHVYSVNSINFDSHGVAGKTRLMVEGMTNTTGWTDCELVPTKKADPQGYMVFDLVATKPTGIVGQAFTPCRAVLTLSTTGLKGVTVQAATNAMSKSYGP